MSINLPLVSVIVPAFNAARFIEKTLRSVLAQTYEYFEVIVVDDGSDDQTPALIQALQQEDTRIRLIRQDNAGVAAARNKAIQMARGALIASIDADDLWFPQNLEKQVACMLEAGPSVGLVYSWSVDIDEQGRLLGSVHASNISGDVFSTLLVHNFLANASCTLIRRAALEKVGLFNTEFKQQDAQGCEDWDLFLRVAEHYQFRVVPEFLVGYRKLSQSMSGNRKAMARSLGLIWKAVEQRYPRIPSSMERLSSSSFYVHLAHESIRLEDYVETWTWLRKSLEKNFLIPFMHFSFIVLALRCAFGLVAKSTLLTRFTEDDRKFNRSTKMERKNKRKALDELSHRQKRLAFRSVSERVLHQWATLFFGRPTDWM